MKKGISIAKNSVLALLIAMFSFFAFLGILNICFKLCYIDTQVRGFSMLPTINSTVNDSQQKGDTIYINKYADFTRNDIIVADVTLTPDIPENITNIVKRIVASPGDRIQIKDHGTYYGVYTNENLLYTRKKTGINTADIKTGTIAYFDKYLKFLDNTEYQKYVYTINGEKYIVMPEGEYFVLGDNWEGTIDSLNFGPIKESNVVGKVEAILPQSHINFFTPTWFMLKLIFNN